MANLVEEDFYIMADVVDHHNKAWSIHLFDDASFYTTNGKVGYTQKSNETKRWPSQTVAKKEYESLKRSKEKKGYVKQQVLRGGTQIEIKPAGDLRDIAKKQIQYNDPTVESLIERLVIKNAHTISVATGGRITYNASTGLFQTPLGIVTKEALDEARNCLISMEPLIVRRDFRDSQYLRLLNRYLMLIPQNLGMRHDPENIYKVPEDLHKQASIIDSLEVSLQQVLAAPDVSGSPKEIIQPKIFSVKLHLVQDGKTIDRITKKYMETLNSGHSCSHLRVKTVYSVEIEVMLDAFIKDGERVGNIYELFHGTRVSNVLSILKSGLLIPPAGSAHCTGRMFSDGLYFAPQSTKAANYSFGFWSSGGRDDNCYMFLARVACGKSFTPQNYYGRYPVMGYDSTWAKSGISRVRNDEVIVYRTSQATLDFLIELSPGGK